MADELTSDLIEARIRNHELESPHERLDDARFAALEMRISALEADHHRHEDYADDEEIETEIVEE